MAANMQGRAGNERLGLTDLQIVKLVPLLQDRVAVLAPELLGQLLALVND